MGEHKTNPMAIAARNGMAPPKGQQVQLNIEDLPKRVCHICKCEAFEPEFKFFAVPEVLRFATQGNDLLITQLYACKDCGQVQNFQQMATIMPEKREEKPVIEIAR